MALRTNLVICGVLFAALFGIAIIGNVLEKLGVGPPTGVYRYVAIALYFGLFLAFGLSAIPVIVKVVLGAQATIHRQNVIIWSIWGLIIAGTVIAVPAAILGGMFGDAPSRAFNRLFEGPNLGTLSARPDMTLDEMVKASTAKIDLRYASAAISGRGVFDFAIPGSAIVLHQARYYYITTYSKDPGRVQAVDIGPSREKMPLAAIDAADAELGTRLIADGWLAGHEVYKTEEDRTLHKGATEGPEGRVWLKDGMVLTIGRNPMDEEKPGQDRATAGEWIQTVSLWPYKESPSIERFVFQPPGARK